MRIANLMFSAKRGGIEQAAVDYCEALKLENHEVTAFVRKGAAIIPDLTEPCIIGEVTTEAVLLVSRTHKRALCASASRPVAYAPPSSGERNPRRKIGAVHAV